MESLIITVHVLAAIALTVLVLLQRGKGAEMGASFGSGASQTMFGSSGSGNVLSKTTTVLAIIFFVTSLSLAVIARQAADMDNLGGGLIEDIDQVQTQTPEPITNDQDVPALQEQDVPDTGDDAEDIPVAPE
ncbi:MAG: preprotein translocase subunit SecG [Gammaproteobacteria bacterium]|nr:preprotein translocase subunit SecG [Gammaproteobacteria bacterium]MAY02997.1 preprotein translocase subunit SecG [Gammaproteobacteria bacterium]|tara:strand:+ start:823 stop:1218 length:396 start_codon:yes stop_codon:yes gene_type:complete